jgi:IS30 family transposase
MTTEEKRRIDILKRDRKSISGIAKELKISPNTIKSYLQRRKAENSCLMCGMHVEQKQGEKTKEVLF